jgi:hypothetical protein
MQTNTNRDDLVEQFAREIGAVRPEDVEAPAKRVTVRKHQTNSGRPVLCSVGKLKPGRTTRARPFHAQKAG